MKMYRFPDNRITKIGIGLLLFSLLVLSRDTLVFSCILGVEMTYLCTIGILLFTGMIFLYVNRKNLKSVFTDQRLLLVLFTTVIMLLPMIWKRDWQMMYFSILLCVYISVFLSYFLNSKEIAKCFIWITLVLAVWSIFATYILRELPDRGLLNVPVFFNVKEKDFYNFGFAFVSVDFQEYRNWGIFREPGVYQYFLILPLYLNNYVVEWEKRNFQLLVNVVLSLAMVLTVSTNGVVELALLIIVIFFDKKLYKNTAVLWGAIVCTGLLLAAVIFSVISESFLYDYLYKVFAKIFLMTGSTTHRLDAIFTDLKFFLENPFFGEKIATVLYSVKNNTTSTMTMFAFFGIVGGLFHVVSWFAFVWSNQRSVWSNLALLAILFIAFNTQFLNANLFFWLFPMMALVERGLPFLQAKRIPKAGE